MIGQRAMKYWHWWVITFFTLSFLCCIASCAVGAFTLPSWDPGELELSDEAQEAEEEIAALIRFVEWLPISFLWWLVGMVVVVVLTMLIVLLTLVVK